MAFKKVFLIVSIALFFNCSDKQIFERNEIDEISFKNSLINSSDEGPISANVVFEEEDVFYVYPPYFPLKEIVKEIYGFSNTFYYIERESADFIDVNEGLYLIISTKDNTVKKCLPITRKQFSFERLKSNKFMVDKTQLILNKLDENIINIDLIVEDKGGNSSN